MSNLVQIGLTVQKLLIFFHSRRKFITTLFTGAPKLVFWGFRGENLKCNFSKPQKELPYTETHLLVY